MSGTGNSPARWWRGRGAWLLALAWTWLLPGWLSAAGSAPVVEIEIPVFTGGYGLGFFEETARRYEARRPGVRINLYGDPRIADKVRIRAIGRDFPDATDAALLWPNLIEAGEVVDLTPWLEGPNWEGDARWADTFLPGVLERWRVGEGVYGVPFAHAVICIFYNKRQFAEHGWTVPRTWDELFALAEKMRAAGVAPFSFPGVYLRYGDFFLRAAHYNLVGRAGYDAYNRLEPGTRSDPRFVRAAAVLQRLATECFLEGYEGMTHTAAQLAFIEGRAAMTVSGSWFVSEMRGKLPPDFELGQFNFPVFEDGVADPDDLQTGSGYYFVFSRSRHVAETVDFFRFLTSRERAIAFARQLDSPAAVRGIPAEAFSPLMADTAAMIARSRGSYGQPPGSVAYTALVEQAMTDLRHRLMSGQITPEAFARELEAAAQAVRERAEGPPRVEVRHPWAGGGLIAVLSALWVAVGYAGWRRARRRRAGNAGGGAGSGVWLGRLHGGWAVGFVGPAWLLFAGLVLLPGLGSFLWAFSRWDALNPREWIGLHHFGWLLFESDIFWQALGNNLFVMIVPALVVVPLALFFAALIHRGVGGANLFRACFLFPNILGGVAATLIWLNIFDPAAGIANNLLVSAGRMLEALTGPWWLTGWLESFENFAWLGQERLYWALIPIYIWLTVGFNLVLYLAAMQGIDAQYYEAAEIDGASPLVQFFRITLPMIREVLAISIVFILIGGLNTFELIWLLTAQDPASGSHVLATWMVSTLFREFAVGRATAIAVVMFLLVLAGVAAVLAFSRREEAVA